MTAAEGTIAARSWFGLPWWSVAWRVGAWGGVILMVTSMVYNLVVFGAATILPGPNLLLFVWAVARGALFWILLLAVCAALMVGWLRRFTPPVQAVLFGLAVGVVLSALWVTVRLVASLIMNPELGYSESAHLAAIGDYIVRGQGIGLLAAGTGGWLVAYGTAGLSRRRRVR